MDFITGLPAASDGSGDDSIMVVVDHGLTKGVILIPTKADGLTAEQTANLFISNVYKRFGVPEKVISDRGPQFNSQFFQQFCKALGIKSSMSMAYHPQSDGTTERFNQEIELYLSIYCLSNPSSWKEALPTLEFTHNSRRHADRPQTPFELIMGYQPPSIPSTFVNEHFPSTQERIRLLELWHNEALTAHEIACQRMAKQI